MIDTWHKVRWIARSNVWVVAYRLPGEANTKQKFVPREVAPTDSARHRRAAEKWGDEFIASLDAPALPAIPEVAVLFQRWLEETVAKRLRDGQIAPATVKAYETQFRTWIEPTFGRLRACPEDINVPVIRKWVCDMRGQSSPVSVRNRLSTLSLFLSDINADGWAKLSPNPAEDRAVRQELPALIRRKPVILSPEAAARLEQCRNVPAVRRMRYLTTILALLRDGEVAGLRIFSVDREKGTLGIVQALQIHGPDGYATEGNTKTVGSIRTNPLHPVLWRALCWWITVGWERWTCRKPKPDDFLFPNEDGEAHRPKSAEFLREDLELAGVTGYPGIVFHDLRATGATWLELVGASDACRARLLGHEAKTTAGRHYTAEMLEGDRATLARIIVPGIVLGLDPQHNTVAENSGIYPEPPSRLELETYGLRIHHGTTPGSTIGTQDSQKSTPVHPSSNDIGERKGTSYCAKIVLGEEIVLPARLTELPGAIRDLRRGWDALEATLEELGGSGREDLP